MHSALGPAAQAPADRAAVPAYESLALLLANAGVNDVFGLMGDDTVRLVSVLVGRGLAYHNARHENAAIAMATGYADATRRLGVCVISRGPGTTNGLTAAVNAQRGDAPVLIITGDLRVRPPDNAVQLPDSKEFDVQRMSLSSGLSAFTVHSPAALHTTAC
jgi:thiamine pyrophosphate-dependent acetolactate synthase large subunit-like protein